MHLPHCKPARAVRAAFEAQMPDLRIPVDRRVHQELRRLQLALSLSRDEPRLSLRDLVREAIDLLLRYHRELASSTVPGDDGLVRVGENRVLSEDDEQHARELPAAAVGGVEPDGSLAERRRPRRDPAEETKLRGHGAMAPVAPWGPGTGRTRPNAEPREQAARSQEEAGCNE